MCEESESNITPGLSHGQQQVNGNFLNNSFSSQQQQQSGGMFGNQQSSLFSSTNTGGSLFGTAYNPMTSGSGSLFNPQPKPASNTLFNNTQMNMFGSSLSTTNLAAT